MPKRWNGFNGSIARCSLNWTNGGADSGPPPKRGSWGGVEYRSWPARPGCLARRLRPGCGNWNNVRHNARRKQREYAGQEEVGDW